MRMFRLALAQIDVTVGDLDENSKKILEYIDEAKNMKADLIAFPEMVLPGYPPEDLLFKSQFIQENLIHLEHIAGQTEDIVVVLGFIDLDSDVHNAAAVLYDGKIRDIYHKMFLPNYGVFDEDRYFKSGTKCPTYIVNGTSVGINICEDIWHSAGPTIVQRSNGAEIIVNLNGSPFDIGKRKLRKNMLRARATDNGLFVAYVNLVGGQDELVFDGGSMIVDPEGEVICASPQFKEDILFADLDVESVFRSRVRDPRVRKVRAKTLQEIGTAVEMQISEYVGQGNKPSLMKAEIHDRSEVEEIYDALVLGTKDYVRKCGFSKVLVALSGGIDSALVTAIAVDALGKENVVAVSMPSRFSSEGSKTDAALLCSNLGIDLWTLPIEEPFESFLSTLFPYFDKTEWGVAEENLQSRIRGSLVMAISNKFGWMVLTTGNKSEMATGYATIYGDMAGGYAVIKDVPKLMVYKLGHHRNTLADGEMIPKSILTKPPSAELRDDQKDEDNLPPYEILDPILKAYVEDDLSYEEIVNLGFAEEDVKRAILLVDRNEYKRRQSPPGIKITTRNFGRDRRMPIANRYKPF